MNDNNTLIKGLTSSTEISKYLRKLPHSKIVESNTLKLSYIPCEISRILSIDISVSLKTFTKIKLKKGCKVNIIGFRSIDINYESTDLDRKVYQLNYKIPFSTEIFYSYDNINIKNIYAPVDKFYFKLLNPKEVVVATRMYIAPLL